MVTLLTLLTPENKSLRTLRPLFRRGQGIGLQGNSKNWV
jgi:hypothetical protein